MEYYLQQMQQFEQQNGYRLLDVVDIHGYITPDSLNGQPTRRPGDAAHETLRMTSTRALWDPNYIVPNTSAGDDEFDANGNQTPPQLIPRMHQWVDQNYPGTKLAITEYMWHALGSITGAIAQADILGIFGRESLDYGTLWGPPAPTDPGAMRSRSSSTTMATAASSGKPASPPPPAIRTCSPSSPRSDTIPRSPFWC